MAFRIPTVESCCFCVSLRTAIKLIGFFSLVDVLSVFISSAYAMKYGVEDCTEEKMECGIILGDVVLRIFHAGFIVAMLMTVYKAAHPRFILWWVYANFFVSVVSPLFLNATITKATQTELWIYNLLCLWDVYTCLVGYSYYIEVKEDSQSSMSDSA